MSRKPRVPAVVLHKPSGQDVVFVRQADGRRAMVYLGASGTPAAARRYREVLAQHLAGKPVETSPRRAAPPSEWPTVGQLAAAFLLHAQRFYVGPDGQATRTAVHLRHAVEPLLRLYRDTPTDRFSIRDLGAVRQAIVEAEFGQRLDDDGKPIAGTGRRRCRRYCNELVNRIKLAFRWGVEQRLVPGSTWHELAALRGLPIGRAGLRESAPVEAVTRAQVDAVLPHLPPILQAAVELQWWSGMRPDEVLQLRMQDVDRSQERWTYRPQQHKGRWRGHDRAVVFGPQSRRVLEGLVKADPRAYLIAPSDVMRQRRERWRAARVSKVPPSQQQRDAENAAKPQQLNERFDVATYRRAIHRACDAAGVARWSPHRLRHAAGTRLALDVDIEAAAAVLGHTDVRVTRRYAVGARAKIASAVMAEHG